MKIDIVIPFYRKYHDIPRTAWGLRQNLANINRVIIVNDELWTSDTKSIACTICYGLPLILLDHPHEGFGAHKCANQGLYMVETEYWSLLDADIVLTPGTIQRELEYAAPNKIVYPHVHDIPQSTSTEELHSPKILRKYGYGGTHPDSKPWLRYRDCHTLEHTESSLALNGRSNFPGYGFIDYDYGCRWALEYGIENIILGVGDAYDPGECKPEERKSWSQVNLDMFNVTLKRFKDEFGF